MSTLALTQQVASRTGTTAVLVTIHPDCVVVETKSILHKDVVTLAFDQIDDVEGLSDKFAFHEVGVFKAVVEMLGKLAVNIGAYRALAS